ncbi:hypothetical protein RUM44_005517 [Polyplax serrata]|uniref:Neurotransmitter-gated ion-channel ligand-binding domain-containing protein n=1 Tax=Polyplax serrata TaxID=468196 RepID=A0ABR1AE22_POLSC
MVRPVKYFENQTLVQFQLYPTKIYMDEHEEAIGFQGNILYVWTDAFLKWDPREYEGIDFIRVSSSEIWVPDITVDTWSHSTTSLSMTGAADCHLAHMGNVYCFIMTTLQAPCTPDITFYPFDTQNCTLTFSSSGFVGKYVNFTLFDSRNGIKMTLYRPNVFWELKEATARRQVKHLSVDDESTFYPLIRCTFILKRHSAGHAAIVILPAGVLALLTLLVFWMDNMYTTRVGIASLVILSDVIYCTYLGMILPSNGNKIPTIGNLLDDLRDENGKNPPGNSPSANVQ